ncbi:MAG TPA: hypothetical protein VJI96_00625 [Candidatus Andersenbacteria bacterium]|nr:hypothetical protein [Candidatus Andersenbacteria bacterium]
MNIEKMKELGVAWKALDEKYDNMIIDLIDAPEPSVIAPEKLAEMRKMQDELFDLEVELYKVLQGE